MLELINIRKRYGTSENRPWVLKGINIRFRRNEFTSILGPSGCGKTTLLNIIGGLDQYTDGDLLIDGVSTKAYRDRDWDSYRNYRVGFIFQSYNLIMHQSVLANVEMALTLSGVSRSERRKKAEEALKRVGLEKQIGQKPTELSGGQMQRVAIARALVNDPEIILADEPTGALDSKTSIQIMDLLKEIAADRLVIMVTHNPEIAKTYSTRIIQMVDGEIISDSDPCEKEEINTTKTNPRSTNMSFMTALALSFRNLLTKKGRTFLTAFAGSIGIIGIALILSLTNGLKYMTDDLEHSAVTDNPITIQKTSFDLGSLISTIASSSEAEGCPENMACSVDDLVQNSVRSSEGLIHSNDIASFTQYLNSSEKFSEISDEISFEYDLKPQVYTKSYQKVNPFTLSQDASEIFKELPSSAQRMESQLELLGGSYPSGADEVILVIGEKSSVRDSLLYAAGIKDQAVLESDLEKIRKDASYRVEAAQYSYDDFIGRQFSLILNTDYYRANEDGTFTDMTYDEDYMKSVIDRGRTLKITGVARNKNADDSYIGYTADLTKVLINEISRTDLAAKQKADHEYNVITGQKFDGLLYTYEDALSNLGIYDAGNPTSISIYPKDYASKEKIVSYIDEYNKSMEESGQTEKVIAYTDMLKSLLSGVTNVINIASYVLIALVAISLIVSSIMIAIITYISVLERTREIGILRAIGASKKDIVRVFRSETIIEGLTAGLLGVGIAALLNIVINIIAGSYLEVDSVARMPLSGALILVALSVVLNVLAGNIPSRIAANKNPVEALRTE